MVLMIKDGCEDEYGNQAARLVDIKVEDKCKH
jgi:hypothetical protein